MRTQPVTILSLLILCFPTTNHSQASCHPLFLAPLLFALLPYLLGTWLVHRGYAWHRLPRNGPPIVGPMGWPFLGSLPIMAPLMHRKLAVLSEAHRARRLMAFSLGAMPIVISSHPDTTREILASPAFCDRPTKVSARGLMFDRAIGFAPSGEYWRRLRRIVGANIFSPRRIAAQEVLRWRVANIMIDDVRKEMECGGRVALRGVLQKGSLESMVGSVLGGSLKEMGRLELVEMVREGYELIGEFNLEDYIPLNGMLDLFGVESRCKHLATKVKQLFGKIIEERRMDAGCKDDSFLGLMISLPKEDCLEDSDVIAVLWEMIFRGTDVVAILLEWIMARMALHPNIQSKAQQELEAHVGARSVADSDVPNLRYLQCITKEVLRMHPPGPLLSWARLAVHDTHVGKFFVPAGTTAMVNMWAIAHDESIWEDPWQGRSQHMSTWGAYSNFSAHFDSICNKIIIN